MTLMDKLTNLLVMAAADGSLNEPEIKFLLNRSARWGISRDDFSQALEYACSRRAELRLPGDRAERIAMLKDLIRVMAADGALTETEKRLFATAAAKMRLSKAELDDVIDSVVSGEHEP
jgi:uncharacterized tellurite resistance protein B-like protein